MKKARTLILMVILALALTACNLPNFSWQFRGGKDTLVHYCDSLPGGYGCSWQITIDDRIVWPK